MVEHSVNEKVNTIADSLVDKLCVIVAQAGEQGHEVSEFETPRVANVQVSKMKMPCDHPAYVVTFLVCNEDHLMITPLAYEVARLQERKAQPGPLQELADLVLLHKLMKQLEKMLSQEPKPDAT